MKKNNKKKWLFIIIPVLLIFGFYFYYYNIYLNNQINDLFSIIDNSNNNEDKEDSKLQEIGYGDDIISKINELSEESIALIESRDKLDFLGSLLDDPYFIESNLKNYILVIKENTEKSIRENVELVNTNRYKPFYTEIVETDTTKGKLILANKYYKLPSDFVPENLTNLTAFEGLGSLSKEAYDAFRSMHSAASEEGLRLYATSTYRDYNHQKRLYTNYAANHGQEQADRFSARPGHSEHQTGLAVDFIEPGSTLRAFENTNEFEWLKENSHKYGFILRYPEDKEHITGYMYEPWHYRYVGVEVATYINENKITFDEYYKFYLK